MAQYGRNFYGASYYGASGVFAGQFVSDRTALIDPIRNDGVSSNGTLAFDIATKLIWTTYPYSDSIVFTKEDSKWIIKPGLSMHTNDATAMVKIYITSSDVRLNFISRADGAKVKVDLIRYSLGVEQQRTTKYISTKAQSVLAFENIQFADYIIEVSIDPATPTGTIEISGIEAITTDVALEFKHTLNEVDKLEGWSGFNSIQLTKSYNQSTDEFNYIGSTANITGAVAYQFKLLLATSDNTTSPEVTSFKIHTPNSNFYAEDGFWKILVDLGDEFNPDLGDDIIALQYQATTPGDSVVEIRTRTSEDLAAQWSYWSAPYSISENRLVFNLKETDLEAIYAGDPTAISKLHEGYLVGHMTSPVYSSENITGWTGWNPTYFVNYMDPITEVLNNTKDEKSTYIKIQFLSDKFLNGDFAPIIINNDPQEFILDMQYYNISEIANLQEKMYGAINKIKTPLRVRVSFYIKPGYGSPALDAMNLKSSAYYREVKSFLDFTKEENTGKSAYEGFGSAVFGNNTGIDNVYTDGKAMHSLASIGNFEFTIPEGVINPTYTLTQPNLLEGLASNVTIFWASDKDNGTKESSTSVQTDHVMVQVIEKESFIQKHKHRGSGITIKIDDGDDSYDTYVASNIYYPPLNQDKLKKELYAYYLFNGFDKEDTQNLNVDIRWANEDQLYDTPESTETPWLYRRYLSLNSNSTIYSSIVSTSYGSIVNWSSEEKIIEGIVNENSPFLKIIEEAPKDVVVQIDYEHLPVIDKNVIIASDTPYKVDIIDGSVISEEKRKSSSRINIEIIGTEYSATPATEIDARMIRANDSQDFLFRPNTTQVLAINKNPGLYRTNPAAGYKQGVHFALVNGYIDWSIGYNNPAINPMMPEPGDELYVTYKYRRPEKLYVQYGCSYNRKHYDRANIYRTPVKYYTGRSSYGTDYISKEYTIDELWPTVPESVDKTTLELKATVTDNDYINVYIQDNKVIGTLGHTNPKENWYPHIKDGFYNIGKNDYFLFTSPNIITLGKATVPFAENISYSEGVINQGLLIQEETINLLTNSMFYTSEEEYYETFKETFER